MFDLHVHSAPCLLERPLDDRGTADAHIAAGSSGFVLKGHGEPTAGRAQSVSQPDLDVVGGIVLNRCCGGLDPAAVASALAHGARVIWMPTLDAAAHRAAGLPLPLGRPTAGPPIPTLRHDDPNITAILTLIAEADAVLCTGHLSGPEAASLITQARTLGVRRLLATHPTFTVPGLDARGARQLAELGALVEITAFQLLHQPDTDAASLAQLVREVGVDRIVLSSDAGQPDSPPPPEALSLLVDQLAAQGIDRAALVAAASETPRRLVLA